MHYVQAKHILSPSNGMNLYRGCSHGCIYCDSRSRCYHIDHAFEDIEVKENAIPLLEAALKRKRTKCMLGTGAMTDPYIPLEKELCYIRKALSLALEYGYGFTLQTKSASILRDLDLLIAINRNSKCVVQMTLTTFDEALCKKLEPHVSTTQERIAALKEFQKVGIPTVVWLSPILPFINDTEENIMGILNACADAGVYGIICFGMGLTLRDGNREYFFAQLDKLFPGLTEKYIANYGTAYEIASPNNRALMKLFHEFCEAHSIKHNNDEIFTYLHTFAEKDNQISFFE